MHADESSEAAAPQAKGLLGSFVRSMGTSITGTAALTAEDIQPALVQLKRKLMERNVAEEIAAKCACSRLKAAESPRVHVWARRYWAHSVQSGGWTHSHADVLSFRCRQGLSSSWQTGNISPGHGV